MWVGGAFTEECGAKPKVLVCSIQIFRRRYCKHKIASWRIQRVRKVPIHHYSDRQKNIELK